MASLMPGQGRVTVSLLRSTGQGGQVELANRRATEAWKLRLRIIALFEIPHVFPNFQLNPAAGNRCVSGGQTLQVLATPESSRLHCPHRFTALAGQVTMYSAVVQCNVVQGSAV